MSVSSTPRPRVLHLHRRIQPSGGGQAVAAWTLEALKHCCDVTLLTWDPVDYAGVNRMFGTSLAPGDFRVLRVAGWRRAVAEAMPMPVEQLRLGLLMHAAKQALRDGQFDAVIGTDNEVDFGRVGAQYIHYPWRRPPLEDEMRAIHRLPGAVACYQWLTGPGLGISFDNIRRNRTLVNSGFIAEKFRQIYGVEPEVVYPPVPGGFPRISWEDRENGFVGIGRLHPCKRWGEAVRVVGRLRERGHDVTLTVVGARDIAEELTALEALAERRPWFQLRTNVPREEMVELVARRRYGIHLMVEEHFGIAVAELVRAGCVPFVHRSGGPPEIVGGHSELLFGDEDEAVELASRVIESEGLQRDLAARLAGRAEDFSTERFMERIRAVVGELAGVELGGNA